MNEIARKAIATKLRDTMKLEGLSREDVATLLELPIWVLNSLFSKKGIMEVPEKHMKVFQTWSNSGNKLRYYAEKHGAAKPAPPKAPPARHIHKPVVDNTAKPPKKENIFPKTAGEIKEAIGRAENAEKIYLSLLGAMAKEGISKVRVAEMLNIPIDDIKRLEDGHPIPLGAVSSQTWENIGRWFDSGMTLKQWANIPEEDTVRLHEDSPKENAMAQIFGKLSEGNINDRIEKMLESWEKDLERTERLLSRLDQVKNIDIETADRLEVVLQIVNEIKEMGFEVSIHLSPIR